MKKITIYALSTCLWCKKTKKFFEEKKVPFTAIDYDKLNDDEQEKLMAEIKKDGCNGTFPFTRIGDACVQGYAPDEFEEELKKK